MGATARTANGPVVRRLLEGGSSNNPATGGNATSNVQDDDNGLDDGALFERIVDALEQRVLDELERRGYRNAPGVY